MNNRREFEALFLILYKKWRGWDKQTCAYGVGWDIWQEQQKIIDELKAENPDAPCPVCGGRGRTYECFPENEQELDTPTVPCYNCNNGRLPLTKAQEYRIRELETEIKRLDK